MPIRSISQLSSLHPIWSHPELAGNASNDVIGRYHHVHKAPAGPIVNNCSLPVEFSIGEKERAAPHRRAALRNVMHRAAPEHTAPHHTTPRPAAPPCSAPHQMRPVLPDAQIPYPIPQGAEEDSIDEIAPSLKRLVPSDPGTNKDQATHAVQLLPAE